MLLSSTRSNIFNDRTVDNRMFMEHHSFGKQVFADSLLYNNKTNVANKFPYL